MNISNFKILVLSIFSIFLVSQKSYSQTTLSPGDIAIVSMNCDGTDDFSFVLLKDVTSGTIIKFAESGWLSGGGFRGGGSGSEGTVTWTSSSVITCGNEITISSNGTVTNSGTVSLIGSWSLSSGGDQLLAYQGTFGSPTFIYALNNEGAGVWQANATNTNTSAIPTGLTNGTNAVALNEQDNQSYDCSTITPQASILSAVSDNSNWISDNSTPYTLPIACGFTCGAPVCNISASGLALTSCNNNGTIPLTTDDYITFDLNPVGSVLGATYSVSVSSGTIMPNAGIAYGSATTFQLQNGSAGAGNITVTITDVTGGACTFDQAITDPGSCSSSSCGSETFDNSNATSGYTSNNYVGDNGVTWSYVASRDESSYGITGNGLMLRRLSDGSKVTSSAVAGGIADFTCNLRKAFSGAGNRQVELYVNGTLQGTSIAWDNTAIQTFNVSGINISGPVTIEIRNATAFQVIVDDIDWTCYTACTPPTIAPTSMTFPSTGVTDMQIGFTNGDGTNRLVVMSTAAIASNPVVGTSYTSNTIFGNGTDIGTNEFVVYNGVGSSVTVTGLTPNTTYFVKVFEFINPGECYLIASSLSSSETTGPVVATEIRFTTIPGSCTAINTTYTVVACATDASGNVATSYTNNITVSINTQPGGATLGGALTQAAVAGCATFNDLTLDVAGSYTLNASDGILTAGISGAIVISATCDFSSNWEGLIINELSNGITGDKEYFEFVVAGKCGAIVDIRGWILDDNNGTFSTAGSYPGSSGIAQGHFRLTTNAQWAAIPVGSLILIYNDADKNPLIPAVDTSDSNNDSVYVIPHTASSLFEICNSIPSTTSGGDSTYSPCTYVAPVAGSWSRISIANSGDVAQVRSPMGEYWHGVSYGGANLTGGPDNLKLSSAAGGGKVYYFSDSDYKIAANWSVGVAGTDETPGAANNIANEGWLDTIRNVNASNCPIYPLEFKYMELSLMKLDEKTVKLNWKASIIDEKGYFNVQRSTDGQIFSTIRKVVFNANEEMYSLVDGKLRSAKYYYRIQFHSDDNNMKYYSSIKTISFSDFDVISIYPNPAMNLVNLQFSTIKTDAISITISDVLGKIVLVDRINSENRTNNYKLDVSSLIDGMYVISITSNTTEVIEKIIISK